MIKNIAVINGPNLNLLGSREPALYGLETLAQLEAQWQERAKGYHFSLSTFQSNHEGALIDYIQQQSTHATALIINGGGYSHSSIALADALKATTVIKVEVHITNIFAREPARHHSFLASACDATLSGMGTFGYLAAIDYIYWKVSSHA